MPSANITNDLWNFIFKIRSTRRRHPLTKRPLGLKYFEFAVLDDEDHRLVDRIAVGVE